MSSASPSAADPNSPQEDDQSTGKRKRSSKACHWCHIKKRKCNGQLPCDNCTLAKRDCYYDVATKKRGPRTHGVSELEKRLGMIEDLLQKKIEETGPLQSAGAGSSSKSRKEATSRSDLVDLDRVLSSPAAGLGNGNGSKSRAPTSKYANVKSSSSDALNSPVQQSPVLTTSSNSHSNEDSIITSNPELFKKPLLDHLVRLALEGSNFVIMPLNVDYFLRLYHLGRLPDGLVFSLCAYSARFSPHPALASITPRWRAGEVYFKKSQESLKDAIDRPNIETLLTVLLLVLHEFGSAKVSKAWMLAGMAFRMCQEMRMDGEDMHDDDTLPSQEEWLQKENRRRLFWMSFMIDVLSSNGSGRPRTLNEADAAVLLPVDEQLYQLGIPARSKFLETADPEDDRNVGRGDTHLSIWAYSISLISLMGRVTQWINRNKHPTQGVRRAMPQRMVEDISKQLTDLYASLPLHMQLTPENERTINQRDHKVGSCWIFMHVTYFTTRILLTRSSNPMLAEVKDTTWKCLECLDDATQIVRVVSALSRDSPMIVNSPMVMYGLYTSAATWIQCAYFPNLDLREQASQNIQTILSFIEVMETYWAMGSRLKLILTELWRMQTEAIKLQTATPGPDTNKGVAGADLIELQSPWKEHPDGPNANLVIPPLMRDKANSVYPPTSLPTTSIDGNFTRGIERSVYGPSQLSHMGQSLPPPLVEPNEMPLLNSLTAPALPPLSTPLNPSLNTSSLMQAPQTMPSMPEGLLNNIENYFANNVDDFSLINAGGGDWQQILGEGFDLVGMMDNR